MATYASEILYSDDYRKAIKAAMEKVGESEDEHNSFESFDSDSDHWLVISEMLESKDALITELVGALEDCTEHLEHSTPQGKAAWDKAKDLITKDKGSAQ